MAKNSRKPVSINGIMFDALISEDREYTAQVPEYAVEDGYSVSDNISLAAEKLNMTLFLSDIPLKSSGRQGTSEEAAKELEDMYYTRKVCTVKARGQTYKNMGLTSLKLSKSLDTGGGLEATVAFTKIQKTKSKTAEVPAAYGKSGVTAAPAGAANTSSESTSSSSDSGKRKSIAYSLGESWGLL